jgi:glycosyltransferase involved in cell wall biosynthesis
MAHCAKSSALFENLAIEVIPNCLDTALFRPSDKTDARKALSLPADKKLVLFGAMNATTDTRKGFHFLKESLKILLDGGNLQETELVLFGESELSGQFNPGTKIHFLGKIPDAASLPLLYSAADVFIAPSVQENLSNTVMESLACGTPVVAFNVGGMPDMIRHKNNGYLAKPFECQDLADGISWVLENEKRRLELSESARRRVVQEYESGHIARQHLDLYEKIV